MDQTATVSSGDWNWQDWWDNLPGDAIVQVHKRDLGNRLVELMNEIGNKGFHIMVRFDPERDFNNFTVVIGSYGRIGDGRDPIKIIEKWLKDTNKLQTIRV